MGANKWGDRPYENGHRILVVSSRAQKLPPSSFDARASPSEATRAISGPMWRSLAKDVPRSIRTLGGARKSKNILKASPVRPIERGRPLHLR
jgi:hypothetical protein